MTDPNKLEALSERAKAEPFATNQPEVIWYLDNMWDGEPNTHESELPDHTPYVRADLIPAQPTPEQGRVEELEKAARDVLSNATLVMQGLGEHGGAIVPHYLDTDDNEGEWLRQSIETLRTALAALNKGEG